MPEHRIWIAQVLCPYRHCILATAFDEADDDPTDAKDDLWSSVTLGVTAGRLDRRCGICGDDMILWHVEAGPTRWTTIDEARPFLKEAQRANLATRAFIDYVKQKGG